LPLNFHQGRRTVGPLQSTTPTENSLFGCQNDGVEGPRPIKGARGEKGPGSRSGGVKGKLQDHNWSTETGEKTLHFTKSVLRKGVRSERVMVGWLRGGIRG